MIHIKLIINELKWIFNYKSTSCSLLNKNIHSGNKKNKSCLFLSLLLYIKFIRYYFDVTICVFCFFNLVHSFSHAVIIIIISLSHYYLHYFYYKRGIGPLPFWWNRFCVMTIPGFVGIKTFVVCCCTHIYVKVYLFIKIEKLLITTQYLCNTCKSIAVGDMKCV